MKTLHRYLIVVLPILFFANQARGQWAQTSGPYGGTVQCIIATGTGLLAGTSGGGIFVSTNNGAAWLPVNSGLANLNVHSIVVNGATMFAATDRGVFLSTNGGGSWFPSDTSSLNISVACLAVVGQKVIAATSTGIFRSTNNGTNWASSGLGNTAITSFVTMGGNIFAGTNGGGVFSSSDGSTWIPKSSGLSDLNILSLAANGTTLFAGNDQGSVFVSTDNGTTWTDPLSSNGMPFDLAGDVSSLVVSGSNLFAGTSYSFGTGGIFLSTDNGANWSPIDSGLTNTFINCLAANNTSVLAGTGGGGIFRSTNNGTSWTSINNGLSGTGVRCVYFNGTTLYAGSDYEGVSVSTDNGTTWTRIDSGLTSFTVYSILSVGNNIFVGTDKGVFVSTDAGQTWTQSGLTGTAVYSLAVNISGTMLFAGAANGVYVSTDSGASWSWNYSGLPRDYVTGLPLAVNCIVVSGTRIFAGTNGNGVYLSTDNGEDWSGTWLSGRNGGNYVQSLATMGTSLIAGADGGVFVSTDNGNSWITGWAGPDGARSLVVSGTSIFASGWGWGVFVSQDSGKNWTQVDSDLTNEIVPSIAADGSYLFAGTFGGGVWRRPISQMITAIETASASIPRRFDLEQNYPNPFNPSTVIDYQLPADELVTLNVYDILGRKIETLVNKRERAGNYSVKFNGSTLQSGVYFYRLQAGAYSATKKLMLLK